MPQSALALVQSAPLSAPSIDRVVALIEIKHRLDMVLEADDADGYTARDLLPYFDKVQNRVSRVEQSLKSTKPRLVRVK